MAGRERALVTSAILFKDPVKLLLAVGGDHIRRGAGLPYDPSACRGWH